MNREAILTSPEALRRIRDMKLNPLAQLTAQSLVRDLNAFDYGNLRNASLLFEAIAKRDDTIPGVKGKREKEISQLECAVVVTGEKTPDAEDHKQVLEQFWNNVTAVNAYDRDERGGFKRLVKQMMTAVSFKYACHHIVWEPGRKGLRATFQFVPLWLFENKTGQLRYLEKPYADEGVLMERNRWMVTTGDGLMIPCSIGYFFKRDGLNNLAIFSDKFSVPGVVGATSASADSEEGKAMANAVASFANDWAAALYDVEDPTKLPIHLIEANGNPTAMPMPEIINRVDRKFETLYRGGDLATTSSRDGEGQGASLQGKEGDINKHDDAATIEETLEQVSRQVIEYYFGYGVDPLAKVTLQEARADAPASKLQAATTLADRGARVSLVELAKDMEVSLADEGEEVLGMADGGPRDLDSELEANAGPHHSNFQNRDHKGRFSTGGVGMFSDVVDEKFTTEEEVYQRFATDQQEKIKKDGEVIDEQEGLRSQSFDAFGDWGTGFESSVLVEFGGNPPDIDKLRYVMARRGMQNGQMGTALFTLDDGDDLMVTVRGFETVREARKLAHDVDLNIRTVVDDGRGKWNLVILSDDLDTDVAKFGRMGDIVGDERVEYVQGTFHKIGDWDFENGSHQRGVAIQTGIVADYESKNQKDSGSIQESNSGRQTQRFERDRDRWADANSQRVARRGAAQELLQRREVERFHNASRADVEAAIAADLLPVFRLLEKAGQADTEAARNEILRTADEVFDTVTTPETAEVYERVLAAAFVNGLADGSPDDESRANSHSGPFSRFYKKLFAALKPRS